MITRRIFLEGALAGPALAGTALQSWNPSVAAPAGNAGRHLPLYAVIYAVCAGSCGPAAALIRHIGYEKAAKISLTACHEDLTLREAAPELGFFSAEQFDSRVRPEEMRHPLGGDR